jgi:hypothetical protein
MVPPLNGFSQSVRNMAWHETKTSRCLFSTSVMLRVKSDAFLTCTVIGNETYICHIEPECKQNMEQQYLSYTRMKKFHARQTVGKIMLPLLWVMKSVILEHYKEKGTNVNSTSYWNLNIQFKPVIHIKWQELLSNGVCLQTQWCFPSQC